MAQLIAAISLEFECKLDATAPWTYPTPRALARHIVSTTGGVDDTAPAPLALEAPVATRASNDEPIAVVGLACRMPGGASSAKELWDMLCSSRNGVIEVPSNRWDADAWTDEDRAAPGKSTTRWGGFLDRVDGFDAGFFGVSPREAKQIDPQQRLALELGWEVLEDAAIVPGDLREQPIGVFVGSMWSDYARLTDLAPTLIDPYSATGQDTSIIAARLSYFLGLQGVSLTVNTACSSSLVAIHLACSSLRSGESELALAGGVHIMASPQSTVAMTKFGAMNPAGQCRAFDADANGYVRGEGGGLVLLEPLSKALAAGRRIYCVIRGSAANNDGFSNGLTAPNPMAQEAVLRSALANAALRPQDIDYVETHGPGTILGDPIEAGALGAVIGGPQRPHPMPPLLIGSVKTNLGHLEAAAGVAGFIKTSLALYHRQVPPNLHFEKPNPHIDFTAARLQVPTRIVDWPRMGEGRPARAGVSAFGFGGTNCHAVLEAAPRSRKVLLALSAKPSELRARVLELYDVATRLQRHDQVESLIRAINVRGSRGEARVTALVESRAELRDLLTELLCEQREVSVAPSPAPKIVFVCPGHGSQWHGMARSLMGEPVFRQAIEDCDREIEARAGWSLIDELFISDPEQFLRRPDLVQVSLCAVQIATGRLWRSWGFEPDVFVGHSMGEIAATHLAGAITLSEAILISTTRARMIAEYAPESGGLIVVRLPEEDTFRILGRAAKDLVVGVYAAPNVTILSGPWSAIRRIETVLTSQEVQHQRVDMEFASHSAAMDPVLGPLRVELAGLAPKPAKARICSSVRATWIDGTECGPDYWVRNLRDPVRFRQAITEVADEGPCVFIELSPHPVVLGSIRKILEDHPYPSQTLASGRRGEDERECMLESVAGMFRLGFEPHWDMIHEPELPALPAAIIDKLGPLEIIDQGPTPIVLSGLTRLALCDQAKRLRAVLERDEALSLRDVGYTLATRRTHFEHRASMVASSRAEALDNLAALAAGRPSGSVHESFVDGAGKLALLFTGMGSQRPGMGLQLHATFEVFRETFDACCERFDRELDAPLREVMFARNDPWLQTTAYTQPALFTFELALFRLLETFGLAPDLILGHSIGELVAAHVAGLWTLDDACRFVATRGRLMLSLPPGGAMVSIAAGEDEVGYVLRDYGGALDIAAVNGPQAVVISGDASAAAAVMDHFDLLGCKTARLSVSNAFHSPRLDPILHELRRVAQSLTYSPPTRMLVSNVTGKLASASSLCDPEYWVRQTRSAVRFARGVRTLEDLDVQRFVEVGPTAELCAMAGACLSDKAAVRASFIPCLREREDEVFSVMTALGHLHAIGVEIDWQRLFATWPARAVSLPTYAYQRERHWLDAVRPEAPVSEAAPVTSLYRVRWASAARAEAETEAEAEAEATAAQAAAGSELRVVVIGEADELLGDALAPLPEVERCAELGELERAPDVIVAAISGADDDGDPLATTSRALAIVHAWLADARLDDARLVFVTRRAIAFRTGEDVLDLAAAPVWGLVRAVMREQTQRRASLIDLDDSKTSRAALIAALTRDEDQQIIRGGQHLIGRLEVIDPRSKRGTKAPTLGGASALGTVLVTGGTSGIGALVARHLVDHHGVRNLLLVSRRGPDTPGVDQLRDELEVQGARVTLAACDITNREHLAATLAAIEPTNPLTAIVHAAGVLDDALVPELTPAQLARVFAPKVTAATHLHELTRHLELEAFIVFSSVIGVVGGSGQANYAAANAWLDALAHHRQAQGLAGQSLAWGPWSEVGMAARLSKAAQARLARSGMPATSPRENLAALDLALTQAEATLIPARFDAKALTPTPARPLASVLRSLARAESRAAAKSPAVALKRKLAAVGDHERGQREREEIVRDFVRSEAAATLGLADAGVAAPDRALREFGLDSLMAVELRNRLQANTGLRLPATLLYDHPTPAALAELLLPMLLESLADFEDLDELDELDEPDAATPELAAAATEPRRTARRPSSARPASARPAGAPSSGALGASPIHDDLAIVGVACRFPGDVDTPEQLWQLLVSRVDALTEFPKDRGWPEDLHDPDPHAHGKSMVREGGFLADIAGFDARFFEISPREAAAIDPQQRLLLELSWEALERAGVVPGSLAGSSTGVFIGLATTDYAARVHRTLGAHEGYMTTGSAPSVASGRIAYTLGLEGPALTVDTACSSSLVALHLAAMALRSGECERALVGGATLMSSPNLYVEFSRQGALAPDGRCKAFSAQADGTGWSEGGGVLVLERLSEARRLGHPVLAILRGSAVNQDGRSQGLTAPNGPAQQRVIRAALANAGLDPAQVDAVEAHGTGTKLGDPIEAQALLATYGQAHDADAPLWLGSLKSNIGHTQAAAGIGGIIKMIMALKHGVLPPSLHAEAPSPHVDWSSGAVRLLDQVVDWPPGDEPRRAGVSSFGISGTNAHVILEEPPLDLAATVTRTEVEPDVATPLLISAIDAASLRAQAGRLRTHLLSQRKLALTDVGYTLATRRAHFAHRACVIASSRADAVDGLRALAAGRPSAIVHQGSVDRSGKLAVLFTGQGSQRGGTGRQLYDHFAVFREVIEACCLRFDALLDAPLREIMFATDDERLDHTIYTQPALFTLELAVLRLLEAFGVEPHYMLGHSIGELVAAHAAGVLSLDDACALVATRGRLMQALPEGGAMAAIAAAEDEVLPVVRDHAGLDIAAINGPTALVISGDEAAVDAVVAHFDQLGCKTKRLQVSHAFHSSHLDPMLDEFRELASELGYHPATRPVISNLSGDLIDPSAYADPEYWVRHARGAVRFADSVAALERLGVRRFVELGPRGVLCGMAAACVSAELSARARFLPCLGTEPDEVVSLLAALASLHADGVELDWSPMFAARGAQPVDLPTYAFSRKRYWIDPPALTVQAAPPIAASDPSRCTSPGPELAGASLAGEATCALDPLAPEPEDGDAPDEPERAPIEANLAVAVRHADAVAARALIREQILSLLAAVMHVDPANLDADAPFASLGLDSLMSVEMRNRLQIATGLPLPATLLFEADTVGALTRTLLARLIDADERDDADADADADADTGATGRAPAAHDWREDFGLADAMSFDSREQAIGQVLLTGATGFVGTHILAELLRNEDLTIHALVRGDDEDRAHQRLLDQFWRWGHPKALIEDAGDRVKVVLGDLAAPRLGLDELAWWRLAARVDVVVCNGAQVDWLLPYSELRETNVIGTLRSLEFAAAGRPKRVVIMSTAGAGELRGDRIYEAPTDRPAYDIGYTLTKLVTEHLVMRAQTRGLDGVILRPGLISASRVTGISNPAQIEYRYLRACLELRAVPDVALNLDLPPVDVVAAMVVEATLSAGTSGEILHTTLPSVYTPRWLRDIIASLGVPCEIVSEARWHELLRRRVEAGHLDLAPLQAFFPLLRRFPHIDTSRAQTLLSSARAKPDLAAIIKRMLARIARGLEHSEGVEQRIG